MKKFTAILLCVLLLVPTTLVAYAGGGIWPDQQLTYKDANTRTEKPPVGPDGVIGFMLYENSNTIVFEDEPRDGSIQRLAYYTNSGDHDWYLSQMYWDGLNGAFAFRPWNTTTPASGNCYLQWDLGYRTKLDQIELYYLNTADGSSLFAPPKSVKFAYSDDGEVWTEVAAADYDLTDVETIKKYYDDDTAQAMVNAYNQWLSYRSDPDNNPALTSEQTALLTKSVVYPLGFNARYLRYYPLANGQQAYMDEGGTYINIKFVKMYDFSFPWEGSGTQEDPYVINSLRTMDDLSRWARGGFDTTDKYFSLETDLDYTGKSWTPFDFYGVFEGNSHTIAGLTMGTSHESRMNYKYGGLVEDNYGTIRDLRIDNALFYLYNSSSDSRLGGIASVNHGTIERCFVEDSIISLSTTGVGGGITGTNYGTIKGCYVARSQVDNSRPGGIVGDNENGSTVENCFVYNMIHIGYGSWGNSTMTNSMGSIVASGNLNVMSCYHNNEDSIFSVGPNSSGDKKSDEEFADGTVTSLLNNGGSVWIQGSDYPELASFASVINDITEETATALDYVYANKSTADAGYVKISNTESTVFTFGGKAIASDDTFTFNVNTDSVTMNVWKVIDGATYVAAPYIGFFADGNGCINANGYIMKAFETEGSLASGEVLSKGATGIQTNGTDVTAYVEEGDGIFVVLGDSAEDRYVLVSVEDGATATYTLTTVETYEGKTGITFVPAAVEKSYAVKYVVADRGYVEYNISIGVGKFPWEGNGTEASPYLISSAQQLVELNNWDKGAHYAGLYFQLTADLDLSGVSWTPVTEFNGILDGDGHVISNLQIGSESNLLTGDRSVGFIRVNSGTVKNLGFEKANIWVGYTDSDGRIGTIAGINKGTIDSCYVIDADIYNATTSVAGGIAGEQNDRNAVISNCYVAGNNTSIKSSRSGGIVGDNTSGTVQNSFTYDLGYVNYGDPNQGANSNGAYGWNTGVKGSVIAQNSATTSNNYYYNTLGIGDGGGASEQTATQFADGTVLAVLNDSAWVQGSAYPVLAVFAKEVETEITSAALAGGNVSVEYTISPEVTSGVAFVVVYNGDYMVGVKKVALDSTSTAITANEADLVKLIILENMSTIKPVCVAPEFLLK